jgi:hypothetical protein
MEREQSESELASCQEIAIEYFVRWLLANDGGKELEVIRAELLVMMSNQSSIQNSVWAHLQNMIEDYYDNQDQCFTPD